ncbi:MAG TPA: class I SAM-dependent methyltransferase [Gemmatimonadaceae bacterium]|nr:class I SAM-dependent methyltransferase [Gemmatimonadaceae bacterium]
MSTMQVDESQSHQGGFDSTLFGRLFAAEDRHFWFQSRNAILAAVLTGIERNLQPNYRVAEIGCGTGVVLRMLTHLFRRGTTIGMDLHVEGLRYARQRTGAMLIAADVAAPPIRAGFDVVGMFDVLEHIPDDERILRHVIRLLKPAGYLVLTVPAHPSLWSYADDVARHCRRYTRRSLTDVLQRAGFRIEYQTDFMTVLLPIMWLTRRGSRRALTDAEKIERTGSELRVVPGLNEIMTWALTQEARFIGRRARLPFGTSLLVVARPAA